MQPFLLMIAPVRTDPDFARKMTIVSDLCLMHRLECRLPSVDPAPFNIAVELSAIQAAHHIIADLSYGRPSCYYELGLVEALHKQAALIAGTGTEIFQNAGNCSVGFFDSLDGYAELVADILGG